MFQKFMTGALIAGGVAGLLAALLHFAFVQESLLLGEQYESGAIIHFQSVETAEGAQGAAVEDMAGAQPEDATASEGVDTVTRNTMTVAFTIVLYIGYAMLMIAGFGIAAQFGIGIGAAQGVLWGLAGYASFQLAPAMGLPPELPGTAAAEIGARQVWWWGTVFASGAGIGLLVYGRGLAFGALGVALLAAPHLIGAPELDGFFSNAPAELGAVFSTRVLGVGFVTWVVLGWVAGAVWSRTVDV